MPTWIVVPCLLRLRDEFDDLAPHRDKQEEGTIGDKNHHSTSDHTPDERSVHLRHKDADNLNEVHALDIDADLRLPGTTMEAAVQFLLTRCRSGAEKRVRYIIFNRRIWSASDGWQQNEYTGKDPHTGHAHFSAKYDTPLEASTASWRLEDIPVALTNDDKKWLSAEITKQVRGCIDDHLEPQHRPGHRHRRPDRTERPGHRERPGRLGGQPPTPRPGRRRQAGSHPTEGRSALILTRSERAQAADHLVQGGNQPSRVLGQISLARDHPVNMQENTDGRVARGGLGPDKRTVQAHLPPINRGEAVVADPGQPHHDVPSLPRGRLGPPLRPVPASSRLNPLDIHGDGVDRSLVGPHPLKLAVVINPVLRSKRPRQDQRRARNPRGTPNHVMPRRPSRAGRRSEGAGFTARAPTVRPGPRTPPVIIKSTHQRYPRSRPGEPGPLTTAEMMPAQPVERPGRWATQPVGDPAGGVPTVSHNRAHGHQSRGQTQATRPRGVGRSGCGAETRT
ncbi:hypothetical protein M1L60_12175 [Actinoplanes sp. TRM 88003]|uniref:Uncharacterized protein n=1 Tax=Paractinoplanes aksuensis TaxID=2939490 RepID=A0ABT1DKI6_9ACTN|nr:hypothetical protein [Actinoplanes aksuensis]MCO8271351.1 hypothetical protein [Actinoplanes aksuensis]